MMGMLWKFIWQPVVHLSWNKTIKVYGDETNTQSLKANEEALSWHPKKKNLKKEGWNL